MNVPTPVWMASPRVAGPQTAGGSPGTAPLTHWRRNLICRLASHALGLMACVFLLLPAAAATRYRPGDIVENFALTDRSTRQPLSLSDLEGKIVFLEWFAWWCPFCQASAPQVESGIVQWYAERGGNPAGIEVVHVAINLQPGQETQTGNFVTRAGFDLVLEDFDRALANRFQSGGQPIFAIVNGVTNSLTHRPWELLLHQDGYGQRNFSASIGEFRVAIDAVVTPVAQPPPVITIHPANRTLFEGDSLRLEVVAEGPGPLSYEWRRNDLPLPGIVGPMLEVLTVTLPDAGEYRVRVQNSFGETISLPATVTVQQRPVPVPEFRSFSRDSEGQLLIQVVGIGGARSVLESTSDFRTWIVVQELEVTAGTQRVTIDPTRAAYAWFRIRNE